MKFFAIIWSMIYLVLSSGLSMHFHFCKGNIADFSLYQPTKSCCAVEEKIEEVSCCFAEENTNETATCSIETKSCCEDLEINFSIFSEKIVPAIISFTGFDYEYFSPSHLVEEITLSTLFSYYIQANAPPDVGTLLSPKKLFLLFNSLVLYH